MINVKEVINLKLPFPNIDSGLAKKVHMYICTDKSKDICFVKSQTFKPNILNYVDNYIIENSDINRNPFNRTTLIDLDKEFHINHVEISRDSLSRTRPDICDELFWDITAKKRYPKHEVMDNTSLILLNPNYLKEII